MLSTTLMHRRAPGAILAACVALAGCGGSHAQPQRPAARGTVPLLRAPARPGEVVVGAEASPRTAGPYRFAGTYRVRFQQYAPEDPRLDFGGETPFVAQLERRQGAPAIRLFRAAAGRGERTLALRGHFYVDVTFGDYPFALRFTPVRR